MNYVYLVLLLAVHGKIISGQGIGSELLPLFDGIVDEIEQLSTLSNNSDSSRISNNEEFIETRANTTKDITIETLTVPVDVKTSLDDFASTTGLPLPVSIGTMSTDSETLHVSQQSITETDSETLHVSQQSITDASITSNTTIASSAIFIHSSSSPFTETSQSASQSSQSNFTKSTPNTTILSSSEKTTYSSEQITSGSGKTTNATEKTTAAIENTTPATEKPTSAREKPTTATEKSTNATEKTTPASEKTSIAAEKIITNPISTASVETVTSSVSNSVSTTFSNFVTPRSTRQQTSSKKLETTSTVAATTSSNMKSTNSVTVSKKGTFVFDTTSVDEEGISESPLVYVSGGGRTIKMAIAIAFLSIAVLATAAVLVYYLSLRRRPFEYDELRMLP